jgi:tetratricopeptide (TPR) repeat protein
MVRRLLALVVALLLAVLVVRNAAVDALADRNPDAAARIWAGHPTAQLSLALTEIGRAARERKAVPPAVFNLVNEAATKAPLAPEPFLVRGVQSQLAGNVRQAIADFEAAELRDPRSLAARYFLADAYFRTNDARHGLQEVLALSRLAPHGIDTVAPYVATYAKDPRTWPQLREMFRADANIEDASLTKLASNVANADTVLALADWDHVATGTTWVPILVNSLVTAGQYDRARAIWARQWKAPPASTIFNADFAESKAATPFNWELVSSTVGLAERQPGGKLHTIFYGQEDGMLARQLLVLRPGNYRVTMKVSGDPARTRSLHWAVRCDKKDAPLGAIGLDAISARGLTFTVPADCPAQWLELGGTSGDISQQVDATIEGLKLERLNG